MWRIFGVDIAGTSSIKRQEIIRRYFCFLLEMIKRMMQSESTEKKTVIVPKRIGIAKGQ